MHFLHLSKQFANKRKGAHSDRGENTLAEMNAFAHWYGILAHNTKFVNDIEIVSILKTAENFVRISCVFIYIAFNRYIVICQRGEKG